MKTKLIPLLGGLLLLACGSAFAEGSLSRVTVHPVIESQGNKWVSRSVTTSTDTVVIISSVSASSGNGIADWRLREITNIGGDELVLYPDNSNFSVFESTRGVHLSSYTQANAPYPRSRSLPGDSIYYGIWNTGGTEANAGAIVNEFYYK